MSRIREEGDKGGVEYEDWPTMVTREWSKINGKRRVVAGIPQYGHCIHYITFTAGVGLFRGGVKIVALVSCLEQGQI